MSATDTTAAVLKRGEMSSLVRLHIYSPLGRDMTLYQMSKDGTGMKLKVVVAEDATPTEGEDKADDVLHVTYDKLVPESFGPDYASGGMHLTLVTNKVPTFKVV